MDQPDIWWIALIALGVFFWWQLKKKCGCNQAPSCPSTGAGV